MQIVSRAPVRTADLGGWTDTWFASSGYVCSIAVEPGIQVELELNSGRRGHVDGPMITVDAGMGATVYVLTPGRPPDRVDPLIAAAVAAAPPPFDVSIRITSGVPAGCGLGTSAALAVALLGGLHAVHGRSPAPADLASEAHRIETSLGLQSGVQDQLAAAFGGAHLFEISYPGLKSAPKRVPEALMRKLDSSLVTFYLGHPHRSSAIHEQVIASLESTDNDHLLEPLRIAANNGFAALCAEDLDAYGRALHDNHRAQIRLHPALVSDLASRVVEAAGEFGARGWKVNGAGGEGGSVSVLAPDDEKLRTQMIAAVEAIESVTRLSLRCASSGLTVVRVR